MIDKNFFAIFILYNPTTLDLIESNIKILNSFNIGIYVYDNTDDDFIRERNKNELLTLFKDLNYFDSDGRNNGLSYAYNSIISALLATELNLNKGVYFFDQDSVITSNSISELIEYYDKLITIKDFGLISGNPLRKNQMPYRIRQVYNDKLNFENLIEVYQTSSSFSLIPLSLFKELGLFSDDFFIDHIDMDFCLRAKLIGKRIFIAKNATYIHEIGIGDVELAGFFLFPYGQPQRNYYQIRNMILSYKRSSQPIGIILKETIIRFAIVTFIGFYKGNLVQRLKYFFKGINHAIKNRGGKL